jgi:hypothetical protein
MGGDHGTKLLVGRTGLSAADLSVGYFWHLVTFADRYHQLAMYRDDMIIPLGLASMTVQALLFGWVYPRLFVSQGTHWLRGATSFGLVFGGLAWSFAVLPVAAKYRTASVPDFLVLETTFTALQFLIVSPLIALVYRGAPAGDGRVLAR